VLHHARAVDPGEDRDEAARDPLLAERRREPPGGLDAVLERDRDAASRDERREPRRELRHLPRLDRDEHRVGGPERAGLLGHLSDARRERPEG
jgi:hypothetical protein